MILYILFVLIFDIFNGKKADITNSLAQLSKMLINER